MHEVYRRFLRSMDLETWAGCLDAYRDAFDDPAVGLTDAQLTEALCLGAYTQWLAGGSGDLAREGSAADAFRRFVEALDHRHQAAPNSSTTRGWALVLAWRGYRQTARGLVDQSTPIGPEFALLMSSGNRAQQAAELRDFVSGSPDEAFPPAIVIYCGALVELGAIVEAEELLSRARLDPRSPLVIDLLGQIRERSGRWSEAFAVYRNSSWPAHRYRASLTGTIAQGGHRPDPAEDPLRIDEAFTRTLLSFEAEIDQGEVVRCTSFVNACLWRSFDDWIVRYELGKLGFRRRRYAEADAHLQRALALAPNECRPAIADLRFTNLTWLSGVAFSQDLSMTPEAIEAGLEAIALSNDPHRFPGIRLWIAAETNRHSLLPPPADTYGRATLGGIHRFVGNRPEAIDCWLGCLREGYDHRAILELIRVFAAAGFDECVDHLMGLVLAESQDDFFALWELAKDLLSARDFVAEGSEAFDRMNRRIDALAERLVELSQFEFQHLVRAYEFFARTNRQDIAEGLLRRAGALAESAAEELAIAVIRRKAWWFQMREGDPQALIHLARAERESRDRLERLQIARELGHHGRLQRARKILEEQRIFDRGEGLQHAEFIAALQCGPWLKPEEFTQLADAALAALDRDLKAGTLRSNGRLFFHRLVKTIGATDLPLAERWLRTWTPPAETESGAGSPTAGAKDPWTGAWRQWLIGLEDTKNLETEMDRYLEKSKALEAGGGFAENLATWVWAEVRIATAIDGLRSARPDPGRNLQPLRMSLAAEDDARTVQLCDLWRGFLTARDDAARNDARNRIQAFEANEARLLEAWERDRRLKAETPRRRAVFYLESTRPLLSSLVSGIDRESHPVLAGLRPCLAEDCRKSRTRLASRTEVVRRDPDPRPVDSGS